MMQLRAAFDPSWEIEIYEDNPPTDELKRRVKDADIIITPNHLGIKPEVIDSAESLKYIIVPATGYDGIDVTYATSKGVKVVNCPLHNSQAVAEHAIALMFAVSRQVVQASRSIIGGRWRDEEYEGLQIKARTIGLVGYGNIGKRIGELAKGLGMDTRFVNSKSTTDELNDLVSKSDIVCLSLPLTFQTKHLFNRQRLDLLQPHAILINVGRGGVVDQSALLEMLESNHFRGAGLDVFENEPLTGGVPNETIVNLAKLSNVVATPHIGYNTDQVRENLAREICDNIRSCLNGSPINVVN